MAAVDGDGGGVQFGGGDEFGGAGGDEVGVCILAPPQLMSVGAGDAIGPAVPLCTGAASGGGTRWSL